MKQILSIATLITASLALTPIQVNYYSDDNCQNYIGTYNQQGESQQCTSISGQPMSILCLNTQDAPNKCSYQQVNGYTSAGCAGEHAIVGCGDDYECVSTLGQPIFNFAWIPNDDCAESGE